MIEGISTILMTIVLVGCAIQPSTATPELKYGRGDVVSVYSGALSSTSPLFIPPNRDDHNAYHYQVFNVRPSKDGRYTFTSKSAMYTCGYLYSPSFDPTFPSDHLITSTDDGDGNRQFRMIWYLNSRDRYVLVVTTYSSRQTGYFSVEVNGAELLTLSPINRTTSPSTYRYYPPDDRSKRNETIAIGVTSSFVIFILICACIYRCKHQRQLRRRLRAFARNTTVSGQETSPNYMRTDEAGHAAMYTLYTISVFEIPNSVGEEPPPSYETATTPSRAPE